MSPFQVTIRASLNGRTPVLPVSSDQTGLIVNTVTLSLSQQSKPPVSVSKSKSNISAADKTQKATQNKKQHGRNANHNLSLKNLRL